MISGIKIIENRNLVEHKVVINRNWRLKKRKRLKKASKFKPVRVILVPSKEYIQCGDTIYIHPFYAEKIFAKLKG